MGGLATKHASQVLRLANEAAHRLRHQYIGPEHILLGLLKLDNSGAAHVLKELGVDRRAVYSEVEKRMEVGDQDALRKNLPLTLGAKKVVECALGEARGMNEIPFGSEHLLLGLLREEEGVATQLLTSCGLRIEQVRNSVLALRSPVHG